MKSKYSINPSPTKKEPIHLTLMNKGRNESISLKQKGMSSVQYRTHSQGI